MDLDAIDKRVTKLEGLMEEVHNHLLSLESKADIVNVLLKWVVTPLIIIVGGQVGIKIIHP